MKLVATKKEYVIEDDSGYSFKITAEQIPSKDNGWAAEVNFTARGGSGGHSTDKAAVHALIPAVRHFLTLLEAEAEGDNNNVDG